MSQFTVPLSRLLHGKHNPRKVKPAREAHDRLVALIRAHGLIHPLVVRPAEGKPKYFQVIAGDRRLAALKEIHRNNGDPKVPCVLRKVDQTTADALSLGENFAREPMHPLDEAEAFANLATREGKGAKAIAAEFGVNEHYVRQRMKLATLAAPIKTAYRQNGIDTATAEAFAAVPEDRQLDVWKELNGRPLNADQVRSVIANDWIDAEQAIFDRSTLPESAISQDLFGQRVLIERQAFLTAQTNALIEEQKQLTDDGWSEAVIAKQEDVQDRLLSMNPLPPEYDDVTARKLAKVESDRRKLHKLATSIPDNDERRIKRLRERFVKLADNERAILKAGTLAFSEATKSRASVFLILGADGTVRREYRLPRPKPKGSGNGSDAAGSRVAERPPTSEDLADRQLAETFTHQALCVREALYKNVLARKRILAMVLHEKVRSEAMAIRHDANGTTLHAHGEGFKSSARDRIAAIRAKLDPLAEHHFVDDEAAYKLFEKLPEKKLDALIDLLVVELVTAHHLRPTALVQHLADELKVNVRDDWRPDANWLSAYQKIQLAHLLTELKGPVHAPPPERKKSDLVDQIQKLFADAATGNLEDKSLISKLNAWLPANLCSQNAADK